MDTDKRPATNCTQSSILWPTLFNIFINYLDNGRKHTLSKSTDSIKLGGVVDKPYICAAVQRDLYILEK